MRSKPKSKPRHLRWDENRRKQPVPKRPYRDTALVYAGMAAVVVVIAFATGGSVRNAIVIAVAFFVVATLWGWRNFRNRLRSERRRP